MIFEEGYNGFINNIKNSSHFNHNILHSPREDANTRSDSKNDSQTSIYNQKKIKNKQSKSKNKTNHLPIPNVFKNQKISYTESGFIMEETLIISEKDEELESSMPE